MRGKGVQRKSTRPSKSPYARAARPDAVTDQSQAQSSGSSAPLSDRQLEQVVSQVTARVAPQLVEAVHQAIEPVTGAQPTGLQTNLQSECPAQHIKPGVMSDLTSPEVTPIKCSVLLNLLQLHPERQLVRELVSGFSSGFSLHYHGPRKHSICRNLLSVEGKEAEVWLKVCKEIKAGRVAGPFNYIPLPNLRISPIGLVPKKDGSWRLIHHLSYPKDNSVNTFIDEDLCKVHNTSFDRFIDIINSLGPNTLMGKMDIKLAFRLLPVDPLDFELLGFKLSDNFFVDKCLPMGCAISCALFEKFSSALEWIVRNKALSLNTELALGLDHYLDDFFFAGRAGTSDCLYLMQKFELVCQELGVPIAEDKTVLPSPVLVFLGLEIDSVNMRIKIPIDKLQALASLLHGVRVKKKVTLKKLQSLAGSLNFCVRAISSNARQVYNTGLARFEDYRQKFNLGLIWPPTQQQVVEFIAFLSSKGIAPATVKSYVAGLGFKCKLLNVSDVTQFFLVKKMLLGMSRLDTRSDTRLPLSPELLRRVIHILPVVCSSTYEAVLFSAIFAVAFFAFLRVGELVVDKQGSAGHALLVHNVKVFDKEGVVEIRLPNSKTDQAGAGVVIALRRNASDICPYILVRKYLDIRRPCPGTFFCHLDSSAVTRYQFSAVLRKSLNALGVEGSYKSHSFRVGAATYAAYKGYSDEHIKEMGRWESRAFKRYIRIPTAELV